MKTWVFLIINEKSNKFLNIVLNMHTFLSEKRAKTTNNWPLRDDC